MKAPRTSNSRRIKAGLPVVFSALTIVILFAFPKAGLYLGGVPVTIGYLLLAIAGALQLIRLARSRRRQIRADYMFLGSLFFALAAVEATLFAAHGYQSLGALVSVLASTLVIPILALLSINLFLDTLGMERFLRVLRISLTIVFGFGVLSFAAYNIAGVVIGIPFLTTTGADIHLVADRHNLRGSMIKMFSTYNNGNILGVNILIWGMVAAAGSRYSLMQSRAICILTLSRSVWLGLAALELANSVVRRSVRRMLFAMTFVSALFVIVIFASWFVGRDPTKFLLDRNLGGRVTNFQNDLQQIGTNKIGWNNESLYAAAYLAFGAAGPLLIASIWAVPIVVGGKSPVERNCRISLAVYLFVATAEAAFNLVPTQATYWMIAGIAMGAGRTAAVGRGDKIDSDTISLEVRRHERAVRNRSPLVSRPRQSA